MRNIPTWCAYPVPSPGSCHVEGLDVYLTDGEGRLHQAPSAPRSPLLLVTMLAHSRVPCERSSSLDSYTFVALFFVWPRWAPGSRPRDPKREVTEPLLPIQAATGHPAHTALPQSADERRAAWVSSALCVWSSHPGILRQAASNSSGSAARMSRWRGGEHGPSAPRPRSPRLW